MSLWQLPTATDGCLCPAKDDFAPSIKAFVTLYADTVIVIGGAEELFEQEDARQRFSAIAGGRQISAYRMAPRSSRRSPSLQAQVPGSFSSTVHNNRRNMLSIRRTLPADGRQDSDNREAKRLSLSNP